jgi:hypothetical protein
MKHIRMIVIGAVTLVGCMDGSSDGLLSSPKMATGEGSLAAGENGTFEHQASGTGGDNGFTDPAVKQLLDAEIGSPEVVARTHGSQKISYVGLGTILGGIGVNLQSTTAGSAGAIYKAGQSALGAPLFASRVPEQSFPSTSSLAKEYDIFAAASGEIVTAFATSKRCAGLTLVQNNLFTKDGLSCLMGKPAKPEHVTLANQAIAEATTPQLGIQIVISALLSAAHTSE